MHAGDPSTVGAYRLTGRLGHGGQGVVYLGTAPGGTEVAVKVLSAEWAQDPGFRRRFEREAQAAQRVASFCTAQVLDAAFDVAQPYIVSEYVAGPSLKEEVEAAGPRSGSELHRLAVATATALVAVHEAGIVHRDFKPANVLMAAEGPRVIDFGIAQTGDATVAQTQSAIGTPGYMAPEQIAGEPVSPATDVFSWGAVMVFAATGRAPFPGDSPHAVAHRVMTAEPDLAGMAEPWLSIAQRCLAKDPAQRPASDELLMRLLGRRDPAGEATDPGAPTVHAGAGGPHARTALQAAAPLAGGAAATAPEGPPASGAETGGAGRSARGRLAVIGAGVALLLVLGAGGYAAWATRSPGPDPSAHDADPPAGVAVGESPSPSDPPAGPSPSARPSPSAAAQAQAQLKVSPSPSPSASPSAEEDKVVFSAPFAGHWVGRGTFPDGTERGYDLVIEQGSATAGLTTTDGACTWSFTLFRTNNKGGFDGSMTTGPGCGPHKGGGFWIDGGRLVVMLWGEEGNFKSHFFWLDRA
ncbi:protein kinase [Streptomonospora sp. PA3]|uniref:protein kinase domain-containing protein n=1 Tax=Streptomonospora sp. PA3 TaxID=2607326 RepID=UPI0021076F90|nr:protein kinase [Streptomonospora sp. PA3]